MDIEDIISSYNGTRRDNKEIHRNQLGGASKCEFFVNPGKRIVVCKLYGTKEAFLDDFSKLGYVPGYRETYDNALVNDFYIGKAICGKNDTFNVGIGKRIAYSKAIKKLNAAKLRKALYVCTVTEELCHDIESMTAQLIDRYNKIIRESEDRIAYFGDCPSVKIKKEGEA